MNSINLTSQLIKCHSVTPKEAGTFKVIKNLFKDTDFNIHEINKNGIKNLFLRWGSKHLPTFGFSGHIDVVTPGEISDWKSNPFSGEIMGEEIYGRGSVDMKSAVAAFCTAAISVSKQTTPLFSIALLITSDEEGKAKDGTKAILEWMDKKNERIDFCVVGEPTCPEKFGDMIKIGRKGSLTGYFSILGKQGHSAYPHLAINPIHASMKLINLLTNKPLDNGSKFFEPSTLVTTSISTTNKSNNVIPKNVEMIVNIRFNDKHSSSSLKKRLNKIFKKLNKKYKLNKKNFIIIEIIDNGKGISESDIKKLFKPFFTTKKSGQGIGLFISQKIINKFDGYIEAACINKETIFTVYLPEN